MDLIPAQPQSVLQDTAPDDDSAGSEGESFTDGGAIPDVHQTTITEQAFSPGISVTPTPYHEGDRTTLPVAEKVNESKLKSINE